MKGYPAPLQRLIEELTKLPTIGPRSAERMALHLLNGSKQQTQALAQAMVAAHEQTVKCTECNGFSEQPRCAICQNKAGRQRQICVVESPQDMSAIEQTGIYHGLYHVLWGRLSPLDNTGPSDLPLRALCERVRQDKIEEVVIATSSNREGEATAVYLRQILQPLHVKISRIARGVPMGINLGHIDRATMSEALRGRREVNP